ncbi:hypothetical protein F444_01957 [Phytophthora nicotianae P1976]|uniref:Uncharacterized protein n=1 Tax=Phytophthora nicotianae P1976 TaxID=1317066 RepID=A0A081AYZ5_PHYNI|nr:hypothetical protein F444_01957 [Phytophthora nicotianae P1976]
MKHKDNFGGAGRGGLQLVKHDGEELNLLFVMDLCQKARQNLYSGYCRVLHAEVSRNLVCYNAEGSPCRSIGDGETSAREGHQFLSALVLKLEHVRGHQASVLRCKLLERGDSPCPSALVVVLNTRGVPGPRCLGDDVVDAKGPPVSVDVLGALQVTRSTRDNLPVEFTYPNWEPVVGAEFQMHLPSFTVNTGLGRRGGDG